MTEHNTSPDEEIADNSPALDEETTGSEEDQTTTEQAQQDEDNFSRPYVEKLRKESAKYRERAKTAEDSTGKLKARLHSALIALDGRLADPDDLPFDESFLEDEEKLTEAITELLEKKPGLRSRKVSGDVGQGRRGTSEHPAGLIDLIRGV